MSDKDKMKCERENIIQRLTEKCEGIFLFMFALLWFLCVKIVFKSIWIDQTTIMDVSLSWPKWKGFDLI